MLYDEYVYSMIILRILFLYTRQSSVFEYLRNFEAKYKKNTSFKRDKLFNNFILRYHIGLITMFSTFPYKSRYRRQW